MVVAQCLSEDEPTEYPSAGAVSVGTSMDSTRGIPTEENEEEEEESVIDLNDGQQWYSEESSYVLDEPQQRSCPADPELQAFYARIPLNEKGELTSVGSLSHATGRCFPCIFHFQFTCIKGVCCSYCHLTHPNLKKKRIRPSKKTRQEIKAMQMDGSGGLFGHL